MAKELILVTGFGTGMAAAEHAAEGLEKVSGKLVNPFTMSQAITSKREIFGRLTELFGEAYMHSAGAMLAREAELDKAHFLNPPLPATLLQLGYRTIKKTGYMLTPGLGIQTTEDKNAALRFTDSAIAEMVTNPYDNFVRILPKVMRFHGLTEAETLQNEGVHTTVTYTDNDLYYRPTPAEKTSAALSGVPVYELPGQHDEVLLNPVQFFENYFAAAEG